MIPEFTPREFQILRLLATGLKNKEIACEIGTTEHVTKNYLRSIYNKVGLWNRTELALWWVANEKVLDNKDSFGVSVG